MTIVTTSGQLLEPFSKMRTKHRLLETGPAISRGMVPADVNRPEIARPRNSVLHVTLAEKATMKGLAGSILAAFDAGLD